MPPTKPKKEDKPKVKEPFKGEEVGAGSHKVEEPVSGKKDKSQDERVTLLESIIRPAYLKARAEGSHSVGNFHQDLGDRIKEWKDLTGKRFPEEF